MSRRPGIVTDHSQPADGGESPNQFHALISVQMRVNWPPLASEEEVREAMMACYEKAIEEMLERRKYTAHGYCIECGLPPWHHKTECPNR